MANKLIPPHSGALDGTFWSLDWSVISEIVPGNMGENVRTAVCIPAWKSASDAVARDQSRFSARGVSTSPLLVPAAHNHPLHSTASRSLQLAFIIHFRFLLCGIGAHSFLFSPPLVFLRKFRACLFHILFPRNFRRGVCSNPVRSCAKSRGATRSREICVPCRWVIRNYPLYFFSPIFDSRLYTFPSTIA